MISEKDHKILKQELISVMDEIHRICSTYDVKYYIVGGTALGSIRHKGFIPWDVDIDIAMRRSDYEKFESVCYKELQPEYIYMSYKNTTDWFKPNAVVAKRSTLINWSREFYKKRRPLPIHVDILPLDWVPEGKDRMRIQSTVIKKKRKMQKFRECVLYANNSWIICIIKRCLSVILRIRSNYAFNHSLDKTMSEYNEKPHSRNLCSMASHYSYCKQCMDESIYGVPSLYAFEDRLYYGPEKMNEYLQQIFGNYWLLPKKEEREIEMKKIDSVLIGI